MADMEPATGPAQLTERVAQLEAQVQALAAELRELRVPASARGRIQSTPQRNPVTTEHPAEPLRQTLQVNRESLETQVGSRLLSKISVILLLIGAAYFFKWAFENRWIGPAGRIVIGLLAGAAVVLWSERFRRNGMAAFSYALKAVGSGVLYLSLWAGFHLYHLMPSWLALTAMLLVTAWNAYMAVSQDSELLAGYALLGAYLTPALLSTGGNHEVFLFTYLFIIAAAVLVLLRLKPWPRLLLGALPATVGYFIAWYAAYVGSFNANLTLFFILLLWAPFAAVALLASEPEGAICGVLTPIGGAAFAARSVYSTLVDSGQAALEPWWAVGFAAVYLLLMRVRRTHVAAAVHLSLGIVFLTVAIPLKATGRGITAGWLAEALALLWVATLPQMDRRATAALRWLAWGSLLLGTGGALLGNWIFPAPGLAFWNRNFFTSIGAVVTLAASILIARRMPRTAARLNGPVIAAVSLVLLNVVVLVSMHHEIFRYFDQASAASQGWWEKYRYADFTFSAWMMLQGAAMLALGFWQRLALARWLGLLLLAATIIKTFAWDMRNLTTGYRVISYLALGVLLMAVSFAYQKDWLKLKDAASLDAPDQPIPNPGAPA
jgi:uncharacterized membrane protein